MVFYSSYQFIASHILEGLWRYFRITYDVILYRLNFISSIMKVVDYSNKKGFVLSLVHVKVLS